MKVRPAMSRTVRGGNRAARLTAAGEPALVLRRTAALRPAQHERYSDAGKKRSS